MPNEPPAAEAAPRALVVSVAGRQVALPLGAVRGVVRVGEASRVPGAPAWVAGLVSVRGRVTVVADLGILGGGCPDAVEGGVVVLVEDGEKTAGLRVGDVAGVREIELAPGDEPRGRLPLLGVARLTSEDASHPDDADRAAVPVVDVRAVLDELLDGDANS